VSDFLQRLEKEVLIGPGTESLRAQYDQLEEHEGWWAINHPDEYQDILRADFNMGCDYITAGGANRFELKKFGLQDKVYEISYGTLKLAKEVVPNNCYLGLSFHGTPWVPPVDDAGLAKLYKHIVGEMTPGQDIGVDFWWIAAADITQTVVSIKAVRDNSKLPIVVGLPFGPTPKGFRTFLGADPTEAPKKFEEAGADIIGPHCGSINYEETTAVLREMRAACSKYLVAKPNAGVPELINGKPVYPGTPEQMAKEAPNWISAGAKLVSGCCGTTNEHIAELIAVLK